MYKEFKLTRLWSDDFMLFRKRNSFWEVDFDQEKKNQATNENHLGAIIQNFSNFIFRQNL